jgi:hypothetical protein
MTVLSAAERRDRGRSLRLGSHGVPHDEQAGLRPDLLDQWTDHDPSWSARRDRRTSALLSGCRVSSPRNDPHRPAPTPALAPALKPVLTAIPPEGCPGRACPGDGRERGCHTPTTARDQGRGHQGRRVLGRRRSRRTPPDSGVRPRAAVSRGGIASHAGAARPRRDHPVRRLGPTAGRCRLCPLRLTSGRVRMPA